VPTAPKWSTIAIQGSATCTGSNAFCVSIAITAQCEDTASSTEEKKIFPAATTTPNAAAEPSTPRQLSYKPKPSSRPGLPDLHFKNEDGQPANSSVSNRELLLRQNSGSGGNGCQSFVLCAPGYCTTPSHVQCLQASINAQTGTLSCTDVTTSVTEDGVVTCQASIHCSIVDAHAQGKTDMTVGTETTWIGSGITSSIQVISTI
jgi:hypothetical protein